MMKIQARINQILKQTLQKQARSLKGTSISNCIVTTESVNMVYSFFDSYMDGSKIQFELVSIKINTENEKVEVFRGSLDYESYFRISSKEADYVQVHIKTNPNNKQIHIVEFKMMGRNKEQQKSKFFLFGCNYEEIISKEPLLMIQIMAHKDINQIHWHPIHQNIFVAITQDSFVLFQCDQSYNELDSVPFKSLEIREKIVDFCFWGNTTKIEKYFIAALGETGKTHIVFICNDQLQNFSGNNEKIQQIVDQVDNLPCIKLYQSLEVNKNSCWIGIKIIRAQYNQKELLLEIKTGYIYRNNKKQSFLEIYHLVSDEQGNYSQRIIVKIQQESSQNSFNEFKLLLNGLWSSSLLYYYEDKVVKLNLSKFLNLLTSPHNIRSKIYSPTQLHNELLLKLTKQQAKFILFQNSGITILRRNEDGKDYDFGRISAEMLELEIGEQSISVKVKKLIQAMDKEMKRTSEYREEQCIFDQITILSDTATEAQIEKFANETQKYMKNTEQYIRNEKAALNNLFEDIKRSSQKLEMKYSKKEKLNTLLKRIQKNGEEIEQRLSKDSQERTYYDDKIEEIQSMVEFVISKPLELEEDSKQMFAADIDAHLKRAQELEEMISQAEKQLTF